MDINPNQNATGRIPAAFAQSRASIARLIVLPPSHYCERARWGLDYCGKPYAETRWAVGMHALLAPRIGAIGTATPMLDLGGGRLIEGSDRILDWAGLAAGDVEIEHRFEDRIGPLVRRLVYAATLGDARSGILRVLLDGVPAWQAAMARMTWPALRRLMQAGLSAQRDRLPELMRDMDSELTWFSSVLKERGRYLCQQSFGRTDITAASLLAPLSRPEASPLHALYKSVVYPPMVERALREWKETPALQWVSGIYSERRWSRKLID